MPAVPQRRLGALFAGQRRPDAFRQRPVQRSYTPSSQPAISPSTSRRSARQIRCSWAGRGTVRHLAARHTTFSSKLSASLAERHHQVVCTAGQVPSGFACSISSRTRERPRPLLGNRLKACARSSRRRIWRVRGHHVTRVRNPTPRYPSASRADRDGLQRVGVLISIPAGRLGAQWPSPGFRVSGELGADLRRVCCGEPMSLAAQDPTSERAWSASVEPIRNGGSKGHRMVSIPMKAVVDGMRCPGSGVEHGRIDICAFAVPREPLGPLGAHADINLLGRHGGANELRGQATRRHSRCGRPRPRAY